MGTQAKSYDLIIPYAVWMGLMMLLPETAWAYAVRGGVTAALLGVTFGRCGIKLLDIRKANWVSGALVGLLVGVLILVIWIAPEMWLGFGSPVAASESPYSPEVCGYSLTVTKLAASALIIPIAEELFFRKWLVEFAGFGWMVLLFAVEHGDRWAVGAITGVAYGLLARRFGLWSAILAHMVTNFILGLIVIFNGRWQFW